MAQVKIIKAENDPRLLVQVRDFLKALNSGNGKPIEQLSPVDARKVSHAPAAGKRPGNPRWRDQP